MTQRHVALLRGINVGRARRVAMRDLRAMFESLGYTDVRTLLNSGNVVFAGRGAPGRHVERIEGALARDLDLPVRVVVLTAAELGTIAAENPFTPDDGAASRLLVAVLADPADRDLLVPLTRESWGADSLALGARAAYLWCPGGVLESPLPEAVARLLGERVTTRNSATIGKLVAAVAPGGSDR